MDFNMQWYILQWYHSTDGQICIDEVDIQVRSEDEIGRDRIAIVPRLNFNCNGRITSIRARTTGPNDGRNDYPYFQIWRPSSSTMYNRVSQVQSQSNQTFLLSSSHEAIINVTLTGDERIEFQSGDVIGYYHPRDIRYDIRNIKTDGYVQYIFDGSPNLTSVDLSTVANDSITDQRQPLIQFTIGETYNYMDTYIV